MAVRLTTRIAAALVVVVTMSAALARAATLSPQSLASSLQRDPVQSLGVPRSSFSALSRAQIRSLRAEIGRLDPGRIWILVVSPRSQSALGSFAGGVFGDLPAGTLLGVADDRQRATTTHFWVGSSWEQSAVAENHLNDVINGFHKGQGSLYDDLRLAVRSFARGDAAAGHPQLSSASGSSQTSASGGGQTSASGGGGDALVIAGVIAAAILLAVGMGLFGRYMRGALRASRRRHEESADAHEQAGADFTRLGEEIEALDIDSSMPGASAAGKDEYAKALECYQEAERRMDKSGDEYQFERAVAAIGRGLDHVHAADRLFNPQGGGVADQLAELTARHNRGALTDGEFAAQKSQLLHRSNNTG